MSDERPEKLVRSEPEEPSNMKKAKLLKRQIRHKRVRRSIIGTGVRPRLAVFRSLSHIYAQLIDDTKGETIIFLSDMKVEGRGKKSEKAYEVGKKVAEAAVKKGIKAVVFDRGGFVYHGRVAKVAEGAREGGLQF